MGSNIAARAATSPELALLRSPGQSSRRFVAIQTPHNIFQCRINQSFTSLDSVYQFLYDTVTGTASDVVCGMTAFISSTGFNDDNKGVVRVRKSPDGTYFYIAETSDIQFANNDYVTVMDLMPPYPRDLRVPGGVAQMDFDIVFGTTPLNPPMTMLGPIVAVILLETDICGNYVPVDFTPPLPTQSYSPDGQSISSYLFACPEASATSSLSTTTPIFTIDTPGQYMWSCKVTDALGRTSTGHRWIFAKDRDAASDPVYTGNDPEGDFSSGGFTMELEGYSGVALANLHERAMVVMYEIDYYNQSENYIELIEDYGNVKYVGWIEDESIEHDPETGTVRFRAQSPAWWLSQIRTYPFGVTDTSTAPTTWVEVQSLTVDKALATLLTWYTTASQIMDCKLTGDTKRVRTVETPASNLWEQLRTIGQTFLWANPLVNQYGQLFIQTDSQYLTSSARNSIPIVMDLTYADMVRGSLKFERKTVSKKSFVELGGIGPYDGTTAEPFFSRAPGTSPKVYGSLDSPQSYIFDDQTDCNFKAGCVLAEANTPYTVSFALAQNNPLISICPLQYLRITVAAGDTPRGIALTNARIIPRRVSQKRIKETGEIQTVVECDMDTIASVTSGITYYPPQVPQTNVMPDGFGFKGFGFGGFPAFDSSFPPLVPQGFDFGDCSASTINGPYTLHFDKHILYGNKPDLADRTATAYFPCTIRSDALASAFHTYINLGIRYWNGAQPHTTVEAIKGGSPVLTISSDDISGPGPVGIDGIRVTLEYGATGDGQHMFQENAPTFVIGALETTSGAPLGSASDSRTISGLTPGYWYMMKSAGDIILGAPPTWLLDGVGPVGNGIPAFPGEIAWDSQTFFDQRPAASYSSADQIGGIHYQDYRLYFLALKSSYTMTIPYNIPFGSFTALVYEATPSYPWFVTLGGGSIKNVCAA